MRCSMLNLQLEGHGLKNIGIRQAQDCLYQGIQKTIAEQSHDLSMTPVSIKQLKATLRQ